MREEFQVDKPLAPESFQGLFSIFSLNPQSLANIQASATPPATPEGEASHSGVNTSL